MRARKLMPLYVIWEDGEGAMVHTIGWFLSRIGNVLTLTSSYEPTSNHSRVPHNITEIPINNIHVEFTTTIERMRQI